MELLEVVVIRYGKQKSYSMNLQTILLTKCMPAWKGFSHTKLTRHFPIVSSSYLFPGT